VPAPTLLVTGGTGAIGAGLVTLLARSPGRTSRIAVLTRTPDEPRTRRLIERWRDSGRVPVMLVRGDLTEPAGLDELEPIRDSIVTVAHLAANTRFTTPIADARRVNVQGTGAILEFARRCPRLESVACVSTVYVAGLRTERIFERELQHAAGFANAYEQSKHEMETLVRSAMSDLPVSVHRLSTAIGESGSGAVPVVNAFHAALQLLYAGLVPMIPGDPATPVDVICTDFAARSLHRLVTEDVESGATYHICAGDSAPTLADVLRTAMETMRRHRPAWRRRQIEEPAIVDLPTYELFVRSVEESGDEAMTRATRSLSSFARQLAHPKTFDTEQADAALVGDIALPDSLTLCSDVVRFCVENRWRAAA